MKFSLFAVAKDNEPTLIEGTWDQLVDSLIDVDAVECTLANCLRSTPPHGCPHKRGTAWSPAFYPPGKTRGKANVEGVSVLTYDCDHLTQQQLEEVHRCCAPYRAVIVPSHSDQPGDRCVRVNIAATRTWSAAEHYRLWPTAARHLGFPKIDTTTCDPSRLYFLARRPSDALDDTATDGSGFDYSINEGEPLDVDAILALAPAAAPPRSATNVAAIPKFKGAPSAEEYTAAVEALGLAWPPRGHRHFAQLALSGALAKAGWPVDLVAQFCSDVAEFVEPGTGDLSKRLSAARSSVEKLATGEPIKGWPKLMEMIGEPAGVAAMQSLGMGLQALETPAFVSRMQDAISAKATVRAIKEEAKAVANAPTRLQIMTFLKAGRDTLRKSKNVDEKHDGELLTKVIKGSFLSSHSDEDGLATLAKTTLALVRVMPPGTLPTQINELLLQPAGSLAPEVPEIVLEAIEHVEQQKAAAKAEIEFDTNKEGTPLANQKNIVLAIDGLGATIKYDKFSGRKMYYDGSGEPSRIQDDNITQLRLRLEREFEFLPTKDLLHDVLTDRALANTYHPVLDYLEPLVWDGTPRVETWLIDAGAPDTTFVRAVSKIALVAAVRRVRSPGCQYDEMLVIEGNTGCQKTSALETLGGVWYHTGMKLDGDAKSTIEQTSGRWIIEAGELSGMARAEVSQLKNWLTSKSDTARAAYGHEPETRPRQFVMIGTTNDVSDYLQDTTGNRRFWPVHVEKFDIEKLRVDRDQIWAEAAHLESEGMSIRLDKALWATAGEEQEARLSVDVFELKLNEKLHSREGRIWILDIVKILGLERPTPAEMVRLGKSMRRLGWEREQVRMGGHKGYAYCKGKAGQQIIVDQLGGIQKASGPATQPIMEN